MRYEIGNKSFSAGIYITVFLVSCSVLMFEIALTRLFSVTLWYHFTFMVISIAMLGIGSAGTVLSVFTKGYASYVPSERENPLKSNIISWLFRRETLVSVYPLLAGFSIYSSLVISSLIPFDPAQFLWDRAQIFYLALYCLSLSLPFFFSGLLIATAFSLYSGRSGLIYGSDLLGAGTGSVLVLVLLKSGPPEYSAITASLLCAAGAFLSGGKPVKITALFFAMIILMILSFYPDLIRMKMSPFKPLSVYLKFPGAEHLKTFYSPYSQIDAFKSPAVRFAPGLSLLYSEPLPDQIGLSRDGDRIDVITDGRNKDGLLFLEFLPSSAGYEMGQKKNDVLILDPGGGLAALAAAYYGSENIYNVESNPLVVEAVRDDYHTFSGNVFEKNTSAGHGRSFLQSRDGASFDLIDLSITGVSVSSTLGISEDYRFTVEAFLQYMKALKKNGMISISLYLTPPPRTEFRILSTLAAAVEQTGTGDIISRFVALRSWDSMTILAKNTPFTLQETEQLKEFSYSKRFDLLYYPGIKKGESSEFIKTASDDYFSGFQKILDPATRQVFIDEYPFDIRPVYDENPFFHDYFKLNNIKAIYETMGRNWLYFMEGGYLLPVIFLIIILSAAVIISIPFIFGKSFKAALRHIVTAQSGPSLLVPVIVFFSMLGLGFMFAEITFIQKTILLLENPAYSFVVVITAILTGSGLGSITSSRFPRSTPPFLLLVLSFIIITYIFIYPMLPPLLYPFHPMLRTTIVFIILLPPGFLMGMPFPAGMKLLGEKCQILIPWAWAVNACMSVLAPILALMIALSAGFSTVLWISALAYSIASFCLGIMKRWQSQFRI
ncbi:MAG: hypothetical protein C4538_09930 [Nitrospiraceae bacterium]|nr:MAG: hypothetical protein C4538_09930 [Nitrospiraceae bacterium]